MPEPLLGRLHLGAELGPQGLGDLAHGPPAVHQPPGQAAGAVEADAAAGEGEAEPLQPVPRPAAGRPRPLQDHPAAGVLAPLREPAGRQVEEVDRLQGIVPGHGIRARAAEIAGRDSGALVVGPQPQSAFIADAELWRIHRIG